jgi:pyrimidine-specific ribonucleoside hydrolase
VSVVLMVAACSSSEGAGETIDAVATTATGSVAATTTTTMIPIDPRRPVIFDYSPTVSDIGALAFLASHPDVRLVAVTLPGTGESHCEQGVAHTRGVLISLGLDGVPVACGPDDPTTGWNAFPSSWRKNADEMDLPVGDPNETRGAPDLIADVVRGSDVPVEVVAVGPLTNLAVAFSDDLGLAGLVAGVTIMGGAVDVSGNVFKNDVGEWNIWVDPTAAHDVFHSGAPVTLVPLDATNQLPSGPIFWKALDDQATTPAAELVRDVWQTNGGWIDNVDGFFFFWDELAAAVLVDESLVTFETRTSRENKGWTREDPAGAAVRVAVGVDRRRFEQLFLDTLIGEAGVLGYLEATADEIAYFDEIERIAAAFDEAVGAEFEAAAAAAGLDENSTDEDGFLDVVAAAMPTILAGPWRAQISGLGVLRAPETLAVLHAEWIAALEAFAAAEEEALAALAAGGFEALEPIFAPAEEACLALKGAAELRLVVIQISCF